MINVIQRVLKIILAIIIVLVDLTVTTPAPEEPLAVPENPIKNTALCAISAPSLANSYSADKLYYLDLLDYLNTKPGVSTSDYYDVALMMSVLQGLVNRSGPHFYIRFSSVNDADKVWLDRLTDDEYWRNTIGTQPQFLAGKEIIVLASPADALYIFRDFYGGYVVWDANVPATSNAALTACGCDSLLPLRYSGRDDSIFANLSNPASGMVFNYKGNMSEKPVKINLYNKFVLGERFVYGTNSKIKSTGSRKCDAVLWALFNYLQAGKTNAHLMAYHIDAYYSAKTAQGEINYPLSHLRSTAFLLNNDYYIAQKAFFFDLGVMKNENASDDPDQIKMVATGAADLALHLAGNPDVTGSAFTAARVILKSPEQVLRWVEKINTAHPEYKLKIIDPYTFMALYAQSH